MGTSGIYICPLSPVHLKLGCAIMAWGFGLQLQFPGRVFAVHSLSCDQRATVHYGQACTFGTVLYFNFENFQDLPNNPEPVFQKAAKC